MTKAEQARLVAWRLRVLRHAEEAPRRVAETCRHFGISRPTFYKWKKRFDAAEAAGLCDRPRTPHRSPRATSLEVSSARSCICGRRITSGRDASPTT